MVESGTYYHSTGDTPSVRPFGLPAPPPGSQVQPPLKGLAGVAVLDGVQLLNAKLRTAQQRRRGLRRYAEYHLECTGTNSYNPLLPPLGEVPRSGKGGVVGDFELLPFNGPHPLSQPVRAASSPIGEPRGLGRIRPRFLKTAGACRKTPQSGPLGLPAPLSGALCRELSLLYTKPRLGTSPWPGV